MMKRDIEAELVALSGCTKEQAKTVTDAFLAIIEKGLLEDGVVDLYGVCRLKIAVRPVQNVRCPRTGQMMKTRESWRVRAFTARPLRQKLNGGRL